MQISQKGSCRKRIKPEQQLTGKPLAQPCVSHTYRRKKRLHPRQLLLVVEACDGDVLRHQQSPGSKRPNQQDGNHIVCTDYRIRHTIQTRESVRRLVQKLIDQGLRRIGFIGDITYCRSIKDRYLGYLAALKDNGIASTPS